MPIRLISALTVGCQPVASSWMASLALARGGATARGGRLAAPASRAWGAGSKTGSTGCWRRTTTGGSPGSSSGHPHRSAIGVATPAPGLARNPRPDRAASAIRRQAIASSASRRRRWSAGPFRTPSAAPVVRSRPAPAASPSRPICRTGPRPSCFRSNAGSARPRPSLRSSQGRPGSRRLRPRRGSPLIRPALAGPCPAPAAVATERGHGPCALSAGRFVRRWCCCGEAGRPGER